MKKELDDSKDLDSGAKKMEVVEVKLGDVISDSDKNEIVFIDKGLVPPDDPPWTWEDVEVVPVPTNISASLHNWNGRDRITSKVLKGAIKKAIGSCRAVYLSDRVYLKYTLDEVCKFLSTDRTSFREYLPEYYDCDDFSKTLLGNVSVALPGCPFGIIWYYGRDPKGKFYGHSVNIFYDAHKKEMILIEPQNDKLYKFTKGRMSANFVMI